jgi:membrane protease YdiL (CAAX protease family)
MREITPKTYPNVVQSFGIAGIIVLIIILYSPVYFALINLIGIEASTLIYNFLVGAIPFWMVYSIRKYNTNEKSFSFTLKNKRILPFIIPGTITLLFGIIIPVQDLIPIPERMEKLFITMGSEIGFWGFTLIVIVTPVFEELIFRGIMLNGLLQRYSPMKSILILGYFGIIIHFSNLYYLP